MTEEKSKALDYIQNIISSMRDASFKCKEFSILICSAFLTIFATVTPTPKLMVLLCAPVLLLFWIIDSFYLYKERLFRNEYTRIVETNYEEKDSSPLHFSAKLSKGKAFCGYLKAMFGSISTILLYGTLFVSSLTVGILLLKGII